LDSCSFINPADLGDMVARAVTGLNDTTAQDVWSRGCAWVMAPDASGRSSLLTIQIGWQGSLHEYSAIPAANPIMGLADEAYALDGGHRIALRSGEVVAVVSYTGASALVAVGLARQVAEQLDEKAC
jgi:hypothetical protein